MRSSAAYRLTVIGAALAAAWLGTSLAGEKPADVTTIGGIQVRILHKLHANKVLSCFETPLEKAGLRMKRDEWRVLGNFLTVRSFESGRQPASTPDQLEGGAHQATLSLLHYPDKTAFGLELSVWTRTADGFTASLWFLLHGATIIGGDSALRIEAPDGTVLFVELPEKKPGSVVESEEKFKAAVAATMKKHYKAAQAGVAKMTECEPTPDAGCDRVPASALTREKEKARLTEEEARVSKLLDQQSAKLFSLASGLYPLQDPNCALYSEDVPKSR